MCPMCHSSGSKPLSIENKTYWVCPGCGLHYLDPGHRLAPAEERERYLLHEPGDEGYARFVSPLLERIAEFTPPGPEVRGLDFGAGQAPVLSVWLRERGYDMSIYDPYFFPEAVQPPFDFIVACEVAEHLYDPPAELRRLKSWLRPGGHLYLMTSILKPTTDFANWYYRRDPTHVVFYTPQTIDWIAQNLGFQKVGANISGNVVVLRAGGV